MIAASAADGLSPHRTLRNRISITAAYERRAPGTAERRKAQENKEQQHHSKSHQDGEALGRGHLLQQLLRTWILIRRSRSLDSLQQHAPHRTAAPCKQELQRSHHGEESECDDSRHRSDSCASTSRQFRLRISPMVKGHPKCSASKHPEEVHRWRERPADSEQHTS